MTELRLTPGFKTGGQQRRAGKGVLYTAPGKFCKEMAPFKSFPSGGLFTVVKNT